ncbi:MAG TPA: T9SS type A sorting domain-containing protein [Ignavibacteria bacterium]|nr:T9SS type A sorting domain-containing protein [Ignavibacteria bacterium]
MNSYTTSDLNKVSNYNLIIGNSGTALQINGSVINSIITGTTNNLYGLYSYNNSSIICGANGFVYRNWQHLNTNSNQKLNSVIQTNVDNCFVTGDNGVILYSNTLNITPNAKQLNSNNISTWFINNGLFNHNPAGSSGFEWPKGEGRFARYTSGSVIGAIVNGDTLVTVCKYGSEYYPGYTDNSGLPQGNGNTDYRIYKMTYSQNDSDRIKWPNSLLGNSDQGAPVYYDSASMQWKPVDYGNQTMFCSYTDSYPESHNQYSGMTSPLKADVKQINWSFNQPEEMKNIIYQEFRIINRSSSVWTNAYLNLYSDDDVGISTDDKGGVDTNLSLTYMYNGSNEDGVYGIAPPAVGFAVIRSPIVFSGNISDTVYYYEGKRKKFKVGYKEMNLGSSVVIREDINEPGSYIQNYNAIRGLKNNGESYINPVSNLSTKFTYSGDPVLNTGWIFPGSTDNKYYQGFGPLNMNPGDTQIIVIAQVIARGSSNINSITKLRESAQTAKDYYNDCFSNIVIGIYDNTSSIPEGFVLYQNYPNPFNPVTNLEFGIPDLGFVLLKVYDMLGKEVKTLVNENLKAGKYKIEFDGSNLPSGIYFYKIETGNFITTKKMLLIK